MKKFRWFIKLCILFFIAGIVSVVGIYVYAYFSAPLKLNSANAIYLYDRNEQIIFQGSGSREWVSLDNISEYVKKAIVSVEDKNFYKHQGFDYLRMARSLYLNFKNQSIVGGASTISQQYVKNMYLDFNQTWSRKIEEALLTINLEVHYNKDEILEGYLNTINFGMGNFGIEAASQYYFNKKSQSLNLEEAIILTGIPRSPENYNPVNNYNKALERAQTVAKSMLKNNYITEEEYDNLFLEPIEIYGKRETNNMQTLMYYHDAVINELNNINSIPKSLINSGGLKIYTAMDFSIQEQMEKSIIKNFDDDKIQTAAIVTDPRTGGVLALTGGVDYAKSQYNRATQSQRHVGSTIKPFLYYAALENNMTSASTFKSEETSFVFSNNQVYTPSNYGSLYGDKNITMSAAIAYSDNIYAVKTHLFLGADELADTLKLAGLHGNINPNPSLALGAEEINMLDYANGYNTLANLGTHNNLYFITRVEDVDGNVLYEREIKPSQVLNPDSVFILNEMMTSTYSPKYVNYAAPTALHLYPELSRNYAIKTGTTDYDYWFVGYNQDIMMLIWSGNDMNEIIPTSYSRKIRNVWVDTVEYALKDIEDNWYEIPKNVVALPLNAISGEFDTSSSNSTLFYFKKGSEPTIFNN